MASVNRLTDGDGGELQQSKEGPDTTDGDDGHGLVTIPAPLGSECAGCGRPAKWAIACACGYFEFEVDCRCDECVPSTLRDRYRAYRRRAELVHLERIFGWQGGKASINYSVNQGQRQR